MKICPLQCEHFYVAVGCESVNIPENIKSPDGKLCRLQNVKLKCAMRAHLDVFSKV